MNAPVITPDEVRRIARLARLALTDDEVARLTTELVQILDYVSQLKALDLQDAEAPLDAPAVGLREDVPRSVLEEDAVLGPAPAVARDHFVVPPVVRE